MGIPVVDKQKQNRENYHVKCSTDYKEPTEDATEGVEMVLTYNKAVAWLKQWVVPVPQLLRVI